MTDAALQEALGFQLSRILEEAAFMLVEDDKAALPAPDPAIEASLEFSGREKGALWLAVSEAGACHLAKEMLGDDLAADPNQCENATAELLNILTAWVLDTWWGKEVEHCMGTPTVARKPLDATVVWSLLAQQRVIVATDAGYTFLCGVSLES